jgi:hypothetical protein
VQVTDSTGDLIARTFTLNIYPVEITTGNILPMVISGRPYSQPLAINPPGSYTWTAVNLPNGLSLVPSTGVISGTVTPGTVGVFIATITAANGAIAVIKNFTLNVKTPQITSLLTGLPTTPLGDVVIGSQVNTVLNVTGGTQPYTVTLEPGPALPPGLALAPATVFNPTTNFGRFAIGGVPTATGVFSFKLRYTDAMGVSAVRNITLPVRAFGLATATPGLATVNSPYSAQLMAVGAPGPFTYSLSPTANNVLPPGIAISPSGLLSGTPTSTGAFSFNVDISDGSATRRQGVTVTVNATGTRRIDFSLGPVTVDAPMGLNLSTALLPSGGSGTHTWSIVAGSLPPGTQLLTGANLPREFTDPTAVISGAPSAAGDSTVRIRVDDSTGNFGIRDVPVHVTPVRIGGPLLPYTLRTAGTPMKVGNPFSFAFSLVNGKAPTVYTDQVGTFMPTGVAMTSAGAFPGTPGESGNFTQFVLATDANQNTRRFTFGFSSYPGTVGLSGIVSPNLADATAGTPYSFNLSDVMFPGFGSCPCTWTMDSGSLPGGLTLAGSVISGNPNTLGTSFFSVLAQDSAGTQHLVSTALNVSNLSMSPGPGALPGAVAGSPYSGVTFTATGGPGPFTFRPAYFSDMPAGLSLSSSGVLSGIPITQGPVSMFIEAIDPSHNVFRQRYTLTVGPPGAPIPSITASPNNVSVGYTIGNPAPSPVPVNIGSTASAFSFTVSSSGGSWLSASPASGNTSTASTVNANFNTAGLVAGTYNGALTVTAGSTSNSPLVIPVTLTVAASPVCNYSLSPGSSTIMGAGGGLNFNVNAGVGCNWTATTFDSWIGVNTPSGTGTAPVSLTIAPNTNPSSRSGSVQVQGLNYFVTQFGTACSFSINPSSLTVSAGASPGNIITVNASAPSCGWTAVGSGFLSVNGAASGTGSGPVTIDIAANPGSTSRFAAASIGGQPLGVNQAGAGCTYALSSSGASLPSTGGPASVNMIAPNGCAWNMDPGPSWVTVAGGGAAAGSGFGTVDFSIAPNSTTATRNANVIIGGQSFLVSQAGASCSFSISANNPVQPAGGGGGSVSITASGGACSWIASTSAPWLNLSTTSGTGNGGVTFTAAANGAAAARSTVLNLAGQSITVNQNGVTCSYSLLSPSANTPSAGGPSSVGVIAAGGCPWSASSPVPWVQITSGAPSSGPGNVGYSVDPNTTGLDRSATLTIAGISFPVTQIAATCVITLGAPSFSAGEFVGASSFGYTTSVSSCNHSVQSFSSWITVNSNPYAGVNGSVNFSFATNTYGVPRSGVIHVGDQQFTVNQAPSSCAYLLGSYGASFPTLGGDGSITGTVLPTACGPPAVIVNGPSGMVTLGGSSSGAGNFSQNYTVSIYQTFIHYVRTAQLLIQGQIFTVKQNSN